MTANMTRRNLVQVGALSALSSGLVRARSQSRGKRRPNIILLVADDAGYRDLGCFGAPVVKTPNLDRVASEGVRFTSFVVSWPACTPSRGSILTGRYPLRNGLYAMIRNNEVDFGFQFDEKNYAVSPEMTLGLDLREVTIGQVLKQAGYVTGVVGKWDSGRARRFLPLQRGFDFFYGFANTGIDYYTHERYGIPSLFRGNDRIKESGHATDLFQREAMRFIEQNRDRPFFLYLPFNAPHFASTFDKKAPWAPPGYMQMYASEPNEGRRKEMALITQMDAAIGAILEQLKTLGLDKDTFVAFVSDNGGGDRRPLRGGKSTLFEGGVRVPFIARWPGRIPAGTTCDGLASTLELFPTFLALAGASPPPGVVLDGFDLLPTLEGRAKSPRSDFFWEHIWEQTSGRAARINQWKWIESTKGGGLFDLSSDLGEEHDLSVDKPDILGHMKARWEAWRKEMGAAEPRGPFRDY
jgi:arylsulfatase A-like enzyme